MLARWGGALRKWPARVAGLLPAVMEHGASARGARERVVVNPQSALHRFPAIGMPSGGNSQVVEQPAASYC